jgi:hypothetical protein
MLAPLLEQDHGQLVSRMAEAKQEKHAKKEEAQALEAERNAAVKTDAKLAREVTLRKVAAQDAVERLADEIRLIERAVRVEAEYKALRRRPPVKDEI